MKRLLKYLLILLAIISTFTVFIAIAVVIQTVDPAQQPPDFEPYTFADTLANQEYDLDSLKAIIGDNKGLPKGFELAAAIAYSAYPQLKDVNIDMILTQSGAPMESSIDIRTLLIPGRSTRQYEILLNDAQGSFFDPILLRALPFDAQVGILAHELGHVAYYHQLNLFEFGKWGYCYLDDEEFRATHEKTTDLMPVYHGLGSQIYQYAWYIRNDPSCLALYEKEKDFIDKYYLTDKELAEFLDNTEQHSMVRVGQ